MELITERLTLHLISEKDYENIHYLHSFPEVDQYNTTGIPNSLKDTIELMAPFVVANQKKERYTFAVHTKAENKFIGMVGLFIGKEKYKSAEVWFKYVPESWGNGYGTEVLKMLITFCFETLALHRLEAGCAVDNIGSIRVIEKAGFKLEGRCRQLLPLKTGWSDNFEFAILDIDV